MKTTNHKVLLEMSRHIDAYRSGQTDLGSVVSSLELHMTLLKAMPASWMNDCRQQWGLLEQICSVNIVNRQTPISDEGEAVVAGALRQLQEMFESAGRSMSIDGSVLLDFEREVLDKLLAGEHPVLTSLREQLPGASIHKREFSNKGFSTYFTPSSYENRTLSNSDRLCVGDVLAELRGVQEGAGFLLFVENDELAMLEGFAYEGSWPENAEIISLEYHAVPRDLSALGAR